MSPRDVDLLVIGDCNPDVLVLGGDVAPAFGQQEKLVGQISLEAGGSAAITAVAAARLGLRVALVAAVGADPAGQFMLGQLTRAGVDVTGVLVRPAGPTGMTVALSRGTDRAILTAPGAMTSLAPGDVPAGLLARARHVHVSSYFLLADSLGPGLAALLSAARAGGATTSLDTNWDPSGRWRSAALTAAIGQAGLLLPNEAEALALSGTSSLDEAVAVLLAAGPRIAVKRGAQGVLCAEGRQRYQVSLPPVTPVDTTGAGDCCNAGLIAGLLQGLPLPQAAALGAAAGALSTAGLGGTAAAPDWPSAAKLASQAAIETLAWATPGPKAAGQAAGGLLSPNGRRSSAGRRDTAGVTLGLTVRPAIRRVRLGDGSNEMTGPPDWDNGLCPVRWLDRHVLVELPQRVDRSNAGPIRDELLAIADQRVLVLLVDMTGTTVCDPHCGDALTWVFQRTMARGIELRLIAGTESVLRVLAASGLDRLVPVCATAAAALAATAPTDIPPVPQAPAVPAAGPAVSRYPADDTGVEIALLDAQGVIVWVNSAWKVFTRANGGDPAAVGPGVSYLDVCAAAAGDPVTAQVEAAIRRALTGDLPGPFTIEVPCHSPRTARWFDMLISSRLDEDGKSTGATVTLSLARSRSRARRAAGHPGPGQPGRDLISGMADRLAAVSDLLEVTAGRTTDLTSGVLQQAIDELAAVVRDARTAGGEPRG